MPGALCARSAFISCADELPTPCRSGIQYCCLPVVSPPTCRCGIIRGMHAVPRGGPPVFGPGRPPAPGPWHLPSFSQHSAQIHIVLHTAPQPVVQPGSPPNPLQRSADQRPVFPFAHRGSRRARRGGGLGLGHFRAGHGLWGRLVMPHRCQGPRGEASGVALQGTRPACSRCRPHHAAEMPLMIAAIACSMGAPSTANPYRRRGRAREPSAL